MFNLNSSTNKSGGLFGNSSSQPPQVSQFGTTVTNNNNTPHSLGGGFSGNTNNFNTNSTGGSMFGNANNNITLGGGLFGSKAPQPTTTGGGLFGNQNPSSNIGTFGNNANNTSLFGNSNNNNTPSLFTQQHNQQQQQNQQQPNQTQFQPELLSTTRQRKLIVEQPKILPSWTKVNDSSKQPPREVIRRLTNVGNDANTNFNNSDDSDSDIEFEEDIFGNVGFGKNKKVGSKRMINKSNISVLELDANKENILNTKLNASDDLPPMKSLFDIEKEMEIDFKIQQNRSNPSIITEELTRNSNEDSHDFNNLNIFDRSDNIKKANENDVLTSSVDTDTNELYSCIIFGYPENISTQILTYFNKFGTILEDFPFLSNSTNTSNKKNLPIETGDSWCKITYDNKVSYLRALKENGTLYSGYIIGCVPNKNNNNNSMLNTSNMETSQSNTNTTGISGVENKNLKTGLLVADIFQKGGVVTSMEEDLNNEKESGKISGKVNELLFGFNGGNI